MDLNRILTSNSDGTYTLNHWQAYFAEYIRHDTYRFENTFDRHVIIENNVCYLLDDNEEILWDSAIPMEDFKRLADIVHQLIPMYVNTPYHRMPWLKIGLDAARTLRSFRAAEKEAQKKARKVLPEPAIPPLPEEVHRFKSGPEWIRLAILQEAPSFLIPHLWRENEICFLFADSNIGKSIYAVQLGFQIASSRKVLYFDYEMDAKDFQRRYTGPGLTIYPIPENFIRCEPNRDVFLLPDSDNIILTDIENIISTQKINVIIIDNITFISDHARNSRGAAYLMHRLKLLQKKYALSILILAHTPKRILSNPLSQNDLDGSKQLLNFADSCFAIGQSAKDPSLQYLKQIKSRGTQIEYDADNILLLERKFSDNWLHFETMGCDCEINHLLRPRPKDRERLTAEVCALSDQGLTQRAIAAGLKISLSKVNRLLNSMPKT